MDRALSNTFKRFFDSEKSSGLLILICTFLALGIANSPFNNLFFNVMHQTLAGMRLDQWINDGLMAVFFLLIGLELERELYNGELSAPKKAMLPLVAAVGGMLVPALIHYSLNADTSTARGMGIPMATDIAFALGILALLGKSVPASLKIFLTALAVIDDLGAIIVIAVFYTTDLHLHDLLSALGVFACLIVMNRVFKVMALFPYLVGGALMWFFMHRSGVHATIAGVLLAFAIPYSHQQDDETSPSHKLEHFLHKPVAFFVLPLFALANAGIVMGSEGPSELLTPNSLGILGGLLVGKPLGITLLVMAAVSLGICKLPANMHWRHVLGAGLLGGIGFTMSIFITHLAFAGDEALINYSKISILLASLLSGTMGYVWLKRMVRGEGFEPPTPAV